MRNIHQWSAIFRALANPYRRELIKLLQKQGKASVSEMSEEIEISIKNTSRNLRILKDVDMLTSLGKSDHVYYEMNPNLDKELKQIIQMFMDPK